MSDERGGHEAQAPPRAATEDERLLESNVIEQLKGHLYFEGPGGGVGREWNALVLPGIIVGRLGYAVGSYLGFGPAYLVRAF